MTRTEKEIIESIENGLDELADYISWLEDIEEDMRDLLQGLKENNE